MNAYGKSMGEFLFPTSGAGAKPDWIDELFRPQQKGPNEVRTRENRSFKDSEYTVRNGEYITNDGQWKWNAHRQLWEELANPMPIKTETTVNAANSMIFTLAITTRAVQNQLGQVTESEKIIVGPEVVTALDQNSAILSLGIKHAAQFDKYDPGLLLVNIRQGV